MLLISQVIDKDNNGALVGSPKTLEILPANPVAANTRVADFPPTSAGFRSGEPTSFQISLFDVYGNRVPTTSYVDRYESNVRLEIVQENGVSLFIGGDGLQISEVDGAFVTRFSPTSPGRIFIDLSINGEALKDPTGQRYSALVQSGGASAAEVSLPRNAQTLSGVSIRMCFPLYQHWQEKIYACGFLMCKLQNDSVLAGSSVCI